MIDKITITLISTALVIAFALKVKTQNTFNSVSEQKVAGCNCFNGIGSSDQDTPALTFSFSNGKAVSICGYKSDESTPNELLISEFNIFDCSNGTKYVEYGALENCAIKTAKDLIKIELLKYLPTGENWTWKTITIAEQQLTPHSNELKASELKPSYTPVQISEDQQKAFLTGLKKGQGFGENWEEDIAKLEVLALNGNNRAWEILKNYEAFTGEQTDGALAETWKEAIATVEWLTAKK